MYVTLISRRNCKRSEDGQNTKHDIFYYNINVTQSNVK